MVREISHGFQAHNISPGKKLDSISNKENIDPALEKTIDQVGKAIIGANGPTKQKTKISKPSVDPQTQSLRESSEDVAQIGLESVKSEVAAKKGEAAPSMPTKEQLQAAVYRPFFPGAAAQDDTAVRLDDLHAFSSTREMGTGTANTTGMYRTTIEGQDYFVKRVSSFVAQGAMTIDAVAHQLGFESRVLPTTFVENPADEKSAFLLTPMLAEVHDVQTEVLTTALGDSAKDFLTRMAVFDHIISNTDRSNIKQLMESEGHIYLADNDNSLEQYGLDFDSRTGGHVIAQYADDMNISYKELEVPQDLIANAAKMMDALDDLVGHFTDPEEKELVKATLHKGLEGVIALKDLAKPTLGDLHEMSPTMDRLMGF